MALLYESTPLVSVIIPTYNRTNIRRSVESVLSQDYEKLEVIVVDDNANLPKHRNAVRNALLDYINEGKISIIYNDKNSGGAISRNNGILACKGEYIAFLDDDDWYLPGKITKQVRALQSTDAAMAYCWSRGEDSEGNIVWTNRKSKEGNLVFEAMTECIANTSMIMCKREALQQVELFTDTPCKQDVLLELKLAVAGYSFVCVKEELVVYGNAEMSTKRISNLTPKTLKGYSNVREYARKYYGLLTRKQIRFVEGDTAYKMCMVAKKIGNRSSYCREMKIAIRNLREPRRLGRLLIGFIFWKKR